MKKIVSAVMGLAAGAALAVEQPAVQVVAFSSQGPDTYADGKTVILNGECYALVWSADGVFEGINADGTPKDANDKVIYIGAFADGGKCKYVEFHIANGFFTADEREKGGRFGLWLLDTRVFKEGELQSFGWPAGGKGIISYAVPAANASVAASFAAATPGEMVGDATTADRSTVDLDKIDPPVIDGPYFTADTAGNKLVQIGIKKTVRGAKIVINCADNVKMTGARKSAVTTGSGDDMLLFAPDIGDDNGLRCYNAVYEK